MKNEKPENSKINKLDIFSPEEIRDLSDKKFEPSPSNTFKRDGILTEKLIVNGQDTKMCLVQDTINKGSWLVTNRYRVIPHGRVLKMISTVADELNLKLKPVEQPAFKNTRGYKVLKDGSTIASDGRYMLASFTANREVTVKGDDVINAGVTVVNTMDTSTALHIVPFTLRMVCMNQFHAFMTSVKSWAGQYGSPMIKRAKEQYSHSNDLQGRYKTLKDFIDALTKRQVHTGELTEEMIASKISLNLELAVGFANDFKKLDNIPLVADPENTQKIVDSMPVGVNEKLSMITIERVRPKKGDKKQNKLTYNDKVTQYDLFNDYTNILTHNSDVASSSMIRQLGRHKKLTRLFNFGNIRPIEVRAR